MAQLCVTKWWNAIGQRHRILRLCLPANDRLKTLVPIRLLVDRKRAGSCDWNILQKRPLMDHTTNTCKIKCPSSFVIFLFVWSLVYLSLLAGSRHSWGWSSFPCQRALVAASLNFQNLIFRGLEHRLFLSFQRLGDFCGYEGMVWWECEEWCLIFSENLSFQSCYTWNRPDHTSHISNSSLIH